MQSGMVLITSLLLLVVVTLLALAMFRGVGLEARIAGNTMDKQRSMQAAMTAQQYGEQWLMNTLNANLLAPLTDCKGSPGATTAAPVICQPPGALSTLLGPATATVPWKIGAVQVGYTYNPNDAAGHAEFQVTTPGPNSYSAAPVVYIAELGQDAAAANTVDYEIDSWSYGGSTSTVAVVRSVYKITCLSCFNTH